MVSQFPSCLSQLATGWHIIEISCKMPTGTRGNLVLTDKATVVNQHGLFLVANSFVGRGNVIVCMT